MRPPRHLALLVALVALAMDAVAILLRVPNSALTGEAASMGSNGWGSLVIAATFPAVGWLITSRRPDNRIGWLLLVAGFWQAVEVLSTQYAAYGLVANPGAVPFAAVAAWVGRWAWMPGIALLFPALLLFPDGQLPTRRWRVVLWLAVVDLAFMLPPSVIALWPFRGPLLYFGAIPSAMEQALEIPDLLISIGNLLLVPVALATVLGVVVRFRRSSGVERQQLKWFTTAGAIAIIVLMLTGFSSLPPPWDLIVAVLTWPLIPLSIAIAILRYRLYDIDVVIRRTLVYVPLTALLAGIYAASIGISQRIFIAVIGKESDGAVILSTLILATTFTPIKNLIQARVDRAFREATGAEARLASFNQAIEDAWSTPEPARTIRAFLAIAISAVRAGGGAAFVASGNGERPLGDSPGRTGPAVLHVPIGDPGHIFGRLELDAQAGGRAYGERELDAVRSAAARLAVALGGIDFPATVASGIRVARLAEIPDPVE